MQLNVLIIDDSRTIRSVLRRIILMSGIPVGNFYEAGNGQEGLERLDQVKMDLVLLDLHMPVMNGQEMIRRMRSQPAWANIPVIVVSSESSQTRIESIQSQGIHFIHKPFTPEKIRSIVEHYWQLTTTRATQEMLVQVTQDVLESMTFVAVQTDAPPTDDRRPDIRAVIRFSGECAGCLALDVSRELLPVLTHNMLGMDEREQINPEQENDALGELANIICGNILARLNGPEKLFDLDVPHIQPLPSEGRRHKENATSVHLGLEQGVVELSLFQESGQSLMQTA